MLVVASIGYFAVLLRSPQVTATERSRVRAFIPLFIANAAFWALFQQIFTTLAVYSDERMDWNSSAGPHRRASSARGADLDHPAVGRVRRDVDPARRPAPSTPRKFAYGVIGMGVAFLLFLLFAGGTGKSTPAVAVLVILAFFAISELLLSPIGLAVTTKLAPEAFRAQMMALYFFSVGIGTSLSGRLAGFYSADNEFAYFGVNGAVVIVIGLVMFAIAPWISRQMEGVH